MSTRYHPSLLISSWVLGTVLLHHVDGRGKLLGSVMILVGTMLFWWCRSTTEGVK